VLQFSVINQRFSLYLRGPWPVPVTRTNLKINIKCRGPEIRFASVRLFGHGPRIPGHNFLITPAATVS